MTNRQSPQRRDTSALLKFLPSLWLADCIFFNLESLVGLNDSLATVGQ
jgi:hypothetical protein